MKKCVDKSKPHVNDESIECGCGITASNCVITSEADSYLKILRGETLTNVIKIVSDALKKLNKKVAFNQYTGIINQVSSDAPTLFQVSNTLGVTFTTTWEGIGYYKIIASSPVFVSGQTFISAPSPSPQKYLVETGIVSSTEMFVYVYCNDAFVCGAVGNAVDNIILNVPITIITK